MQKLTIHRRASENKYLHRDFHAALDQGLAYLAAKYGGSAADEYLDGFARSFYAPLIADVKANGLSALREHIAAVYETEETPAAVTFSEDGGGLKVSVSACPAVAHMRAAGYAPSKWYVKTTSTVNKAIADELGLGFEMMAYDDATGGAEYRFLKREGGR